MKPRQKKPFLKETGVRITEFFLPKDITSLKFKIVEVSGGQPSKICTFQNTLTLIRIEDAIDCCIFIGANKYIPKVGDVYFVPSGGSYEYFGAKLKMSISSFSPHGPRERTMKSTKKN